MNRAKLQSWHQMEISSKVWNKKIKFCTVTCMESILRVNVRSWYQKKIVILSAYIEYNTHPNIGVALYQGWANYNLSN